jgi:hypothetical protein
MISLSLSPHTTSAQPQTTARYSSLFQIEPKRRGKSLIRAKAKEELPEVQYMESFFRNRNQS